jgi:hypothetical protein
MSIMLQDMYKLLRDIYITIRITLWPSDYFLHAEEVGLQYPGQVQNMFFRRQD